MALSRCRERKAIPAFDIGGASLVHEPVGQLNPVGLVMIEIRRGNIALIWCHHNPLRLPSGESIIPASTFESPLPFCQTHPFRHTPDMDILLREGNLDICFAEGIIDLIVQFTPGPEKNIGR